MRASLLALLFLAALPLQAGLILIPDQTPTIGAPGDPIELTVVDLGTENGVAGSKIYGSYDGRSGSGEGGGTAILLEARRCAVTETCELLPPPSTGVGSYDGTTVFFHYSFTVTFDAESRDNFGFTFTFQLDDRDPVQLALGENLAPGSYSGDASFTVPDLGGAAISNWFLTGSFYAMPAAGEQYISSRYIGIEIPPQSIDLTGAAPAPTPVPEPGTWVLTLAGLGLAGISPRAVRRRSAHPAEPPAARG